MRKKSSACADTAESLNSAASPAASPPAACGAGATPLGVPGGTVVGPFFAAPSPAGLAAAPCPPTPEPPLVTLAPVRLPAVTCWVRCTTAVGATLGASAGVVEVPAGAVEVPEDPAGAPVDAGAVEVVVEGSADDPAPSCAGAGVWGLVVVTGGAVLSPVPAVPVGTSAPSAAPGPPRPAVRPPPASTESTARRAHRRGARGALIRGLSAVLLDGR